MYNTKIILVWSYEYCYFYDASKIILDYEKIVDMELGGCQNSNINAKCTNTQFFSSV